MKKDTTASNAPEELPVETNPKAKSISSSKPFWSFINGRRFGKGIDISEKTAATLVKHSQSSLTEIHENTTRSTSEITSRTVEAISNIGVAHESKASEAIEAIERVSMSGQQSNIQGSQTASKGILHSAVLIIGLVGGAIGIISSAKK